MCAPGNEEGSAGIYRRWIAEMDYHVDVISDVETVRTFDGESYAAVLVVGDLYHIREDGSFERLPDPKHHLGVVQVVNRARRRNKDLPIIAMTTSDEHATADIRRAGASEAFTMPANPREVMATMKSYLSDG